MNTLVRWLIGAFCAGLGALPALITSRPAFEVLTTYAWCVGVAAVAVTVLWIATLGIRR